MPSRHRRISSTRVGANIAALMLSTALLGGCTIAPLDNQPVVEAAAPGTQAQAAGVPRAEEFGGTGQIADKLRSIATEVEVAYGGSVGIAVQTAYGPVRVGDSGNSAAWSTMKVPVAIAAAQQGVATDALIDASISASENDTAATLWALLGGGTTAAHAVEDLLWRNGGEADVRSYAEDIWASPFGMSTWSLESQAAFGASLPCIPDADHVYGAMGEIVEWQNNGLGTIPGVHFKGGWSEEENHHLYTNRQFGSLVTDEGVLGLSVIAHPADGSHETSAAMLTSIADGLHTMISRGQLLPAQECLPTA